MHKTAAQAVTFVEELKPALEGITDVEVAVCPSFVALAQVVETLRESNIAVGAQNMFWEAQGAYTGEVSPVMLKDLGCRYVIIGHSERRFYFGEEDDLINKKIKAALAHGLAPILCVGEQLEEREANLAEQVVSRQISAALSDLTAEQVSGLIIAYEPVWAIGTGKTASNEDAQQMIAFIRSLLKNQYGEEVAARVRIQYGGSVKPENAAGLMAQPDIDGALVGGASLNATDFTVIVKAASGKCHCEVTEGN